MSFFDFFKDPADVGPMPQGSPQGFFGTSWQDPRTQANLALFAGLLQGGNGKGFAGALGDGLQGYSAARRHNDDYRLQQDAFGMRKKAFEDETEQRRKAQELEQRKYEAEQQRENEIRNVYSGTMFPQSQGQSQGQNNIPPYLRDPMAQRPQQPAQQQAPKMGMDQHADLINKGNLLLSLGHRDEAQKAFTMAKNFEPQTSNEPQIVKTMRAAGIPEGSKQWNDALQSEILSSSGRGFMVPGAEDSAIKRALASAGITAANKAPTEFEQKIAIYSQSMRKASSELQELDAKGVTPGLIASVIPDWVPGRPITQGVEQQLLERSGKQWVDSINRIRSGAAMPEIEYERAASVYLPRLGDSKEVRAAKAQARAAEESFLHDVESRVTKRESTLRGDQGGQQFPPMGNQQPPSMQLLPRGTQQQALPTYEEMKRLYGGQ